MNNYEKYFGTPERAALTLNDLHDKLLPCPFCGSEAITLKKDIDRYTVGCENDECLGFLGLGWLYDTEAKAIEAWNKRECHNVNDEERREVATRLRDFESLRDSFRASPLCAFLDALGSKRYMDWKGVCARLADLIEPEERTCKGFRCEETDEWCCSECGGSLCGCMFDPSVDGFVPSPNYCPNCGYKVM